MDEDKLQQMADADYLDRMSQRMEQQPLNPEPNYFEGEIHKFNKFIIENDEIVPKDVPQNFWVFLDREMSLTNLDKVDIKWLLLNFDIAKINFQMSKPDYKLTQEEINMIDQARVKCLLKAKRSFGGPERERVQLTTQIRELRIPEKAREGGHGFLGLFGRRG